MRGGSGKVALHHRQASISNSETSDGRASGAAEAGALRSLIARLLWRPAQVAAAVALVVVPFGYAVTGEHNDVLMGAACGLALGIGVNLRLGVANGRAVGILVGTGVGIATALIAGLLPGDPLAFLVPPVLALAIGLLDGLGEARLRGYREAAREVSLVALLLGIGLLAVEGGFVAALGCVALIPHNALIAGFLNQNREGKRFSRPPLWLLLAFAVEFALITLLRMNEMDSQLTAIEGLASAALWTLILPVPIFWSARAFAVWIRPRLRIYLQLADYLRVMWVPIGGFAVGYLAIIVVFAGFFGMLERFVPLSFLNAADAGVADWISFSFYSAIAEPYPGIAPSSGAARLLTGAQTILSVGWALVVFAAVMSALQPQLERIARRNAPPEDDA